MTLGLAGLAWLAPLDPLDRLDRLDELVIGGLWEMLREGLWVSEPGGSRVACQRPLFALSKNDQTDEPTNRPMNRPTNGPMNGPMKRITD